MITVITYTKHVVMRGDGVDGGCTVCRTDKPQLDKSGVLCDVGFRQKCILVRVRVNASPEVPMIATVPVKHLL